MIAKNWWRDMKPGNDKQLCLHVRALSILFSRLKRLVEAN